jgi:ribosomal protein S18 acetylase RimI-like enzyme
MDRLPRSALARSVDVHALRHQHGLPAPSDPHWNLETLGIVPEAQGRGLGTRLLVPGLAAPTGTRCSPG